MRSASSSIPSRTAITSSVTSTTCSIWSPAASRTISPRQSPTCIRACTRLSSASRASRSRCRSAPGRCTRRRNTALRRTGNTSRVSRAAMKSSSSGSAACWKRSRTPMRRIISTPSRSICSTTRSLSSRRRARSCPCRPAPPPSTLPMPSIPASATPWSAPRSTTALQAMISSCATATSSRF